MKQTDTPAFRRWFGDSKVVDKNGDPLVVYHGSGEKFYEFDSSRLGENTGYADAKVGFHFSDNRADADFYATKAAERLGRDKGFVRGFYLSLQNPLIFGLDDSYGNVGDEFEELVDDKLAAKDFAIQNGHDGIIYLHGTNVDSGYTAIAFDPRQIKSATDNNGDFDPTNPDVRKNPMRRRARANETKTPQAFALLQLLALLRAVYSLHQAHHWDSKGPTYYGDHLLFQRLYEGITPEIDAVAERAVGAGGEVEYVSQSSVKTQILSNFEKQEREAARTVSPADARVVASLEAEKTLLAFIDQVLASGASQGTQNLLQGIADKHEGHVYLLQQRLGVE